jgi:hypothetical protein
MTTHMHISLYLFILALEMCVRVFLMFYFYFYLSLLHWKCMYSCGQIKSTRKIKVFFLPLETIKINRKLFREPPSQF